MSCQQNLPESAAVDVVKNSDREPLQKMNGLSFVAPPKPFSSNPMLKIKEVHANWIAVIPYGFMRNDEPKVNFGQHEWQWWGETPEGAEETIKTAMESGLQVMLKPQIYIHGGWTGDVSFYKEANWKEWETSNEKYILLFAEIAQKYDVPLFCIGTEWKKTVDVREEYWRGLIKKVREIYSGSLVYAANWDEYNKVPFWDALDYIGINAYFPLLNKDQPMASELKKAWLPIENEIASFSKKENRPILFTEFGYMSVENCAHQTWVLEKNRDKCKYSEEAQANALDAIYATFGCKDYWHGSFLWKWYPNEFAGERMKKDYTPQGKKAEEILKKWFKGN